MQDDLGSCIWREPGAVSCYKKERNCRRCGWNPVVEEERKEKLRLMMQEPIVETYSIGRGSINREARKKMSL